MNKLEPRVQTEVLAAASQNSCFMRDSVMSHAAQGIRGLQASGASPAPTYAGKKKRKKGGNVSVTANGSTGFNSGPILNSCCRP